MIGIVPAAVGIVVIEATPGPGNEIMKDLDQCINAVSGEGLLRCSSPKSSDSDSSINLPIYLLCYIAGVVVVCINARFRCNL